MIEPDIVLSPEHVARRVPVGFQDACHARSECPIIFFSNKKQKHEHHN